MAFPRGLFALPLLLATTGLAGAAEAPPAQGTKIHLQKTLFVQDTAAGKVFAETRRVEPGDTLWRVLTREYGIGEDAVPLLVEAFRALNPGADPDRLARGQVLRIPFKVEQSAVPPAPPSRPPPGPEVYTVRAGDSLWRVLQSRYRVPREAMREALAAVARANPQVKSLDHLVVGQRLKIPGALAPEPRPASPPAAPPVPAAQRSVLGLLTQLGCRVAEEGETFLPVSRGRTVRLDARDFPLVVGPGGRTVVLDPREQIAPGLTRAAEETWGYRVVRGVPPDVETYLGQILPHLGFHELSAGVRSVALGPGAELLCRPRWTVVPRPQDLWEGSVHLLFPRGAELDPALVAELRRAGFVPHQLEGAPSPAAAAPWTAATLPWGDPAEGAGRLLALLGVPHRVRPEVDVDLGGQTRYRLRPELTFRAAGLDYAVVPPTPEAAGTLLGRGGFFPVEWLPTTTPLNRLADLLALLGVPHAPTAVELPSGQALRLRVTGVVLESAGLAGLLYPAEASPPGRVLLTEAALPPPLAGLVRRHDLAPWVIRSP